PRRIAETAGLSRHSFGMVKKAVTKHYTFPMNRALRRKFFHFLERPDVWLRGHHHEPGGVPRTPGVALRDGTRPSQDSPNLHSPPRLLENWGFPHFDVHLGQSDPGRAVRS